MSDSNRILKLKFLMKTKVPYNRNEIPKLGARTPPASFTKKIEGNQFENFWASHLGLKRLQTYREDFVVSTF